jgi:hypothetical protein
LRAAARRSAKTFLALLPHHLKNLQIHQLSNSPRRDHNGHTTLNIKPVAFMDGIADALASFWPRFQHFDLVVILAAVNAK